MYCRSLLSCLLILISCIQSQQPSLLLFSFSITSSNMSKNFTQYLITKVTCIISYPFRETVGVVENNGFEPLTPCVQGRCSSQLS
jgi:hypothetical protein